MEAAVARPLTVITGGANLTRRRILVLSPFPPRADGAHGGARAVAGLVAGLAERHAVALAALRTADEPPTDPILHRQCEVVTEVARPRASRLQHVAGLARGLPMWVSERSVESYRACVRGLVREWRPDVVQVEYHAMGQYLDAVAGSHALRVLTEHDPGIPAAREALESATGIARMACRVDLVAWERFERRVLQAVHGAVVFTEHDRLVLTRVAGGTPVRRIPLVFTPTGRSLNPLGGAPPSVAFVGNYLHLPNVDAAIRLATRIFPALRSQWPEARLYLIGRAPPPALRRLSGGPVVVTGQVPEVEPYLERATVIVAPLRRGGGMRVKVLEALGAGKAMVASPLAIEGIGVTHGDQLLLAESDAEFVEAVGRLFAEPELRRALAVRARTWACATLSSERAVEAYEAFYQRLGAEAAHR